jgi:hypothetical protein
MNMPRYLILEWNERPFYEQSLPPLWSRARMDGDVGRVLTLTQLAP